MFKTTIRNNHGILSEHGDPLTNGYDRDIKDKTLMRDL